jgi:hypothetical protein
MGKLGHQRGEGARREDTKGRTSERDCGPLGSRTLKSSEDQVTTKPFCKQS